MNIVKFYARLVMAVMSWYAVASLTGSPIFSTLGIMLLTGWVFGLVKVEVD